MRIALVFLLGAGLYPSVGMADNLLPTTQSFTVSAQIVTGCSVTSGTSGTPNFGMLNFGTYPAVTTGAVSAALTANSGVQIQCTSGTNLSMTIDGGLNPNTTQAQRNLLGPNAALIAYQLYSDAGHTQSIHIGQAVSVAASGTVTLPIYGGLNLPGSGKPVGTYTYRTGHP
jgi:spore coat protein U-like protein